MLLPTDWVSIALSVFIAANLAAIATLFFEIARKGLSTADPRPQQWIGFALMIFGLLCPPLAVLFSNETLPTFVYFVLFLPAGWGFGAFFSSLNPDPHNRRIVRVAGLVISLAITVGLLKVGYDRYSGAREILGLIDGKRDAKIVEFTAEYQRRRVVCRCPEACEFLTRTLRNAGRPAGMSSYHLFHFVFASGDKYSATGDWWEDGLTLSIQDAHPVEIGWDTHQFKFAQPIPSSIAKINQFLLARSDEVAGIELTIGKDGTISEKYIRALDMR